MRIAYVTAGISPVDIALQPWVRHRAELAREGITIEYYDARVADAFGQPHDAMLLHVWLDWNNRQRFDPAEILPVMAAYSTYRHRFPETVQIILNHTDMSRKPYATPYWRSGDPILYRTPAYDRTELAPFPADSIWAYEIAFGARWPATDSPKHSRSLLRQRLGRLKVRGTVALDNVWRGRTPVLARTRQAARGLAVRSGRRSRASFAAGFIGQPTGLPGYRERVAKETARVGLGVCVRGHFYSKAEYDALMEACDIMVCPRGWGEQSARHWDAWSWGKPVLTDRSCDAVEMIPGTRLRDGIHYLVYDDPREIPDIVTDWTRPSRRPELQAIAEAGQRAAASYDAVGRLVRFFRTTVR